MYDSTMVTAQIDVMSALEGNYKISLYIDTQRPVKVFLDILHPSRLVPSIRHQQPAHLYFSTQLALSKGFVKKCRNSQASL